MHCDCYFYKFVRYKCECFSASLFGLFVFRAPVLLKGGEEKGMCHSIYGCAGPDNLASKQGQGSSLVLLGWIIMQYKSYVYIVP